MNRLLLLKGFKRLSWSVFYGFTGPILISQAFKNKDHHLFWIVFISSILLLFLSLFYGITGIKYLVVSLLGEKNKK
tara:strand:- start:777 stop:1004 length:228 start_codon:yes stop_codon:yes gene_type:complete